MARRRTQAGFTLVELLLVMVLLGIIAATTGMLTLQATRAYSDLLDRRDNLHFARLTLERVAREVRQASAVSLASGRLDITTTDRGTISVLRDGATNTVQIAGAVLAKNISTLTFTVDSPSNATWVEVNLTDGVGAKYRTKIWRRKGVFYP